MAIPGFGKATGGGPKFKHLKLETPKNEGESTTLIVGVLPSIGKNIATGKWFDYLKKHFGYRGHDDRDPTKLQLRVFKCHEEKRGKNGPLLKMCHGCEKIYATQAEKATAESEVVKQIKAGKLTSEAGKEALASFDDWLDVHNVDRKYVVFCCTTDLEPADLALGSKAMAQLKAEKKKLESQGFKPMDVDNGIFWEFTRTRASGRRGDVVDKVAPAVEMERDAQGKPTGRQSYKRFQLSEEQQIAVLEALPDFSDLVTDISDEDMKAIVESDGDPDVVDRVFQKKDVARAAQKSASAAPPAETKPAAPPIDEIDDDQPLDDDPPAAPTTPATPAAAAAKTEAPPEKTPVSKGASDFLATLKANGLARTAKA